MKPEEWLIRLLLGGLAGMAGQGVRVIVGLKKTHEEARAANQDFKTVFEASNVVMSFIIGFVAGALAGMAITDRNSDVSQEQIIGLMGAGYAGTDFIEGFITKYLPKTPAALPPAPAASPAVAPPPVG